MKHQRLIMMIAGESSGEMYGSRVIHALKNIVPDINIFGIGGDGMHSEGMELLYHISEMSFMGFIEVITHYPFIRKALHRCIDEMTVRKPDTVVLIDYPGFNLRLAKEAKKLGIRVVYYISPQVWAWGKGRVTKMKDRIDQFAVIFPFEKNIYEAAGIPVEFVGHPLLEILPSRSSCDEFIQKYSLPKNKILAVLPGSRYQEITSLLPTLLSAAKQIHEKTECSIVVGTAPNVSPDVYHRIVNSDPTVHILSGATYQLMQHAHAAFVASGTATLETAIYLTPMVIVYKTSRLNYEIARRLVKVKHIGIVNILADQTIVPELIQHDFKIENLVYTMLPIFTDDHIHSSIREKLQSIREKLGTPGASERVARLILENA